MRPAARTLLIDSRLGGDVATGATEIGHRHGCHGVGLDDEDVAGRLPHGPVELVAEGGMALVYRGHTAAGPVAIKVLRTSLAGLDEYVSAFAAERRMVDRAGHTSVVAIHDSGEIDGVPYLVMDWCDGQTLAERVAFEPMSLRRVTTVGAKLAASLAAIHQAGVVHCDIKPENVMLTAGGEVRVLDFGVARLAGSAPDEPNMISGTPSYMSPEQWVGAATPASDVYSLGCVLYELVTGAPPFTGTFVEVMCGHQSVAPSPVGELRPDLRTPIAALIMSMLAKAPQDRPTASEVATRLTAMAAPRTPAPRRLGVLDRTGPVALAS
jgi:eukaryotic-like serine/threonine-protein kinase